MSKELQMFINAIKSGKAYSFIYENAQHLTFEELKGILLECIYIISVVSKDPCVFRLAEGIKERFEGY